jgi:lambda family phage tail tape measure protein
MPLAVLSIDLVAKLAEFERDMGVAARITEKHANSMSKSLSSIKNMMGGLGAGLAAYLSVDSFANLIKSTAELEDQLGKMSQKTGIGVEELSKLQYAAKLSNVSTDELEKGLIKLSRGMIDTANDSGEARNALAAMGISIKNGDGTLKESSVVLSEIADKFSGYQDGATKAALATKLFGKSGADLIPLLNGGSDGIKQAGDELERLGGVINKEMVKNATEFNDNMARLEVVGSATGKAIANSVIPYINQLATEFMVAKKNGLGFMDMLSMGFRSTDYEKQLKDINDEINMVNQAWAFPIGPSRDERLASLERQKKSVIDLQTLLMKDQLMGPERPKIQTSSAPIPIDLDKLRRQKEAVEEIVIGARNTIQKEQDKIALAMDTSLDSEMQKRLAGDILKVTDAVRDRQEQIAKLMRKGDLDSKGAEEAQRRLNQIQLEGIERATQLNQVQTQLNYSWEYGATKAVKSYMDEVTQMAQQVEQMVGRAFKGLEDQMVSAFTTGKFSFTNMADSIISDMARIVVRQNITSPLAGLFGNLFLSGSRAGGAAPVTDYSSAWAPSAKGNVFGSGIQAFAKGGAFTNSIVNSPTLFKFAKGTGLMGESGPEAILPLSRNSRGQLGVASSNSGVSVVVNNNAAQDGIQARASSSESNGKTIIDIVVEKVKGSMGQDLKNNGAFSQTLANAYGLRRSM